jgi:hypothetical protein
MTTRSQPGLLPGFLLMRVRRQNRPLKSYNAALPAGRSATEVLVRS